MYNSTDLNNKSDTGTKKPHGRKKKVNASQC